MCFHLYHPLNPSNLSLSWGDQLFKVNIHPQLWISWPTQSEKLQTSYTKERKAKTFDLFHLSIIPIHFNSHPSKAAWNRYLSACLCKWLALCLTAGSLASFSSYISKVSAPWFSLGGLYCCPVIALILMSLSYPTSNLLCPTMMFQSIHVCKVLFYLINRHLSHNWNAKGLEFGSIQTILSHIWGNIFWYLYFYGPVGKNIYPIACIGWLFLHVCS